MNLFTINQFIFIFLYVSIQGGGSAHDLFTGSGVTYKVDYDI